MIENPEYNYILINNLKQLIFPACMLALYVFVTSSYYYIISGSNIQHSILAFCKENTVLRKNKCQGQFPTNMLSYFLNL